MTDHQRIASLDLLRGLAAFAVAIPHYLVLNSIAPETAEATSVLSVEVFFVLSGFVLAPQIIDCVRARSFGRLKIFLIRRWMRTIPPYLFALVAISFLVDRLWTADFVRYALYLQNLFFQANASDYYSVAWSLAVEEWFYVLFPISMMLVLWHASKPGNSAFIWTAIGFIALITLGRLAFGPVTDWAKRCGAWSLSASDSIAYGFVLAILLAKYLPLAKGGVHYIVPALLVAMAGTFLAFRDITVVGATGATYSEQLFPFVAALFGCSVLSFFYLIAPIIQRISPLERLSIYLGRISYSIYLFHIIAAQLLFPYGAGLPLAARLGVYIVVIVVFCSLFFWYFERPILAMRPRYSGQHADVQARVANIADAVPE